LPAGLFDKQILTRRYNEKESAVDGQKWRGQDEHAKHYFCELYCQRHETIGTDK
jgi:hypothetical protein